MLRVALGVGLLWYVLVKTGARQAMVPFVETPWVLLVLLAGPAFGAAIEALRLRVLFRAAGLRLGLAGAYKVVMIGTFFNFCIPGGTGGDVVKLYYLAAGNRQRGVEVATVLLLDRVLALIALLVLVLALASWNSGVIAQHPILMALTVTAAAGLGSVLLVMAAVGSRRIRTSRWYSTVLNVLPLRRYVERAADAAHAFRERKRVMLEVTAMSFVGHMGAAVIFAVIGSLVVPEVAARLTAMLALMGMVANAIPVTPGGLGVGEAAFDQLFSIVGATGAAAILIGWRMGLIPFAVAGAVAYMAGGGRRLGGKQDAAPAVSERAATATYGR
ncbi:MAG: flippase-like domain-containing protein [Gemmatimonadota bacterium]|nr:flippase-like domain-containing protein [Gemmatimonadota bacterium]